MWGQALEWDHIKKYGYKTRLYATSHALRTCVNLLSSLRCCSLFLHNRQSFFFFAEQSPHLLSPSVCLCLSDLTSLSSSASIVLVSLCLSHIIFNLSSQTFARQFLQRLSPSLSLSRSWRALSVSLLLRNLTSLSSLVSAAGLPQSLYLFLIFI